MVLNNKQRDIIATKFADLANIALGALVFGYIVHSDALDKFSLVIGFAIAVFAYFYALVLTKNTP